jgi:hypothetical protein
LRLDSVTWIVRDGRIRQYFDVDDNYKPVVMPRIVYTEQTKQKKRKPSNEQN